MSLLYHPESGCYWFGEMTEGDANNAVEDVTGIPQHEANALEQIGPIDSATGKPTLGNETMTTIESDVPMPAEGNKKAARRARKPKENQSSAQGLIAALKFVGMAQRDAGVKHQTHCIINNHWCVAFDGVLTIGCKVQEDISACPNSKQLLAALLKCGQQISISQLNEFVLSIKSEKFKASIDCISFEDMPISSPDVNVAKLTEEVKKAFECVAWLTQEGATRAFECGALLTTAGSVVATNAHVLLEYWHGCQIPGEILVPKAALVSVINSGKTLTGIGASGTSVTFHFEDESFIKSQIYLDPYPNYSAIFDNYEGPITSLPKDFFVAVDAVSAFSNKMIKLAGDKMQSHEIDELGATYEIAVPDGYCFDFKYLKACQAHFFNTKFRELNGVAFSNGNVRGVIAGGRMS